MRNAIRRWYLGVVPFVGLLIWMTLPVAGQAGAKNGEWTTYGGDLANTRYAPLDQINASNFDKLQVAWRFKTENLGPRPEFNFESTPLMARGVVYSTAGTRRTVVALDGATGELLWMHKEFEGPRGDTAPRGGFSGHLVTSAVQGTHGSRQHRKCRPPPGRPRQPTHPGRDAPDDR